MASYFDEMSFTPLEDGQTPDNILMMARLLRDYNMFDVLGTDKKLPPAASKDIVANLPKVQIKITGTQCPVCLKDFETGMEVIEMPCKHRYHPECILPWLEKTNSCPLCRYEIATDDEEYEAYRKEKQRAIERKKDIENLHNSMFS